MLKKRFNKAKGLFEKSPLHTILSLLFLILFFIKLILNNTVMAGFCLIMLNIELLTILVFSRMEKMQEHIDILDRSVEYKDEHLKEVYRRIGNITTKLERINNDIENINV